MKYLEFIHGDLSLEGIPLQEIAKEFGTPTYVYSAQALLDPFLTLKRGLPQATICFAMKSNSNLAVLKLFAKAGSGVDIVSGGELFRAQKAGFSPEKIVFSGVGKTKAEIREALLFQETGIYSFNVESIEELETIQKIARNLNRKARVALRFNPAVNPKTHPYISTGLRKNKFGMPKKEIHEISNRLKEFSSIHIEGISVHIGSQLLSLAPLEETFQKVLELLDDLPKLCISSIDLGGGLGVRYKAERPPSLENYCKLIRKYFEGSPYKILIEPGRVLTANSGVLLTEVLYRKPRPKQDFLIVDAGMNDLLRPALYGSYHEILPLQEKFLSHKKLTDIVGPVCESSDCFASKRLISTQLSQGDYLAILSAGAYGFSMASTYNSRPKSAEVLIQNSRYKMIRKRETYSSLIQEEILD